MNNKQSAVKQMKQAKNNKKAAPENIDGANLDDGNSMMEILGKEGEEEVLQFNVDLGENDVQDPNRN